jgi:hypothetical protein
MEWAALDGEVVALDMEDSLCLEVNRSGSLLWEALQAGATRSELVQMLVARYAVDHAVAERDVDSFIDFLRARGLVVTADQEDRQEP